MYKFGSRLLWTKFGQTSKPQAHVRWCLILISSFASQSPPCLHLHHQQWVTSSCNLHPCIHGSCHRKICLTTVNEWKCISFNMATISFEIPAYFIAQWLGISFSLSFSTAAILLIISLLIDRYFIQYFILHGTYFIQYFIAYQWGFHSLFHLGISFNISFFMTLILFFMVLIPFNISLLIGRYLIQL